MLLCNFTLQPPTGIVQAIHGNFAGTKSQEIVVSHGKVLDILRLDAQTGKVHTILSVDVFACIRSLLSVRLTGASKDYIFVGSDSGRILVLEYNSAKNILEKVHQETFGKTGCRRIVPGQYLAADPKGRAVMIAAVEKQKLVYILNRDALARLTISSPLEAHKSSSITFHVVGVDVAFENPVFACLEIDYEELDNDPSGETRAQQTLTFYELDLGLNHVVRKYAEPLAEMANLLISVPGGNDGPGGVLVCSENYISYRNMNDQPEVKCSIPRRRNDLDDADRSGAIIVSTATHKTRSMFFFLVQTEQGDLFKVTLKTSDDVNGVLLRAFLDSVSGDLADTRTRYLGLRPIRLFRVLMQKTEAVLALSSRTWLSYSQHSRLYATPLSYEPLEFASGFASEQCPEGIVAIAGSSLRILALEKLGVCFNQETRPLSYTPRRMVISSQTSQPLIYIIGADYASYTEKTKRQRREHIAAQLMESAAVNEPDKPMAKQIADAITADDQKEAQFGTPKAGPGMWASVLTVHDATKPEILFTHQFEQNEAATCIEIVAFNQRPGCTFLLVGASKNLVINPRKPDGGYIYCFQINQTNGQPCLLHKTPTDEVPGAIAPFHGRALIGVGRILRIYDIGRNRLLRKCECKALPSFVMNIQSMGTRIFVGDLQESVQIIKYRKTENQLVVFADDTSPRLLTSVCVLDFNTLAVADKFGTISVLRLNSGVSDNIDVDPTGIKGLWDRGLLNGAPYKLEATNTFFVGETVTCLQKAVINPAGGSECILYTTLSGTIGVLVPFASTEDYYVLQHLEMHMRLEYQTLCGRDHATFRSSYFPVKGVIDGDLCEKFSTLELSKQKTITATFDRTPNEVAKKLEDLRTRFAF